MELDSALGEFDGIRQRLATMCEENGGMKQIENMIDSLNRGFAALQHVVIQNEKAALLAAFYETCYRDNEIGLTRSEYGRFLDRLPRSQRARFEERGTFQELAGEDGVIDLQEFQELVDDIVTECDEQMVRLLGKH